MAWHVLDILWALRCQVCMDVFILGTLAVSMFGDR